jgi:hypothetical protein
MSGIVRSSTLTLNYEPEQRPPGLCAAGDAFQTISDQFRPFQTKIKNVKTKTVSGYEQL